jgi:non-heme chloroperoxidase
VPATALLTWPAPGIAGVRLYWRIAWQYQMIGVVDSGRRAVLADDLARVIYHLDLRAVTLVAHSMGSGEAVRYLTRYGDDRIGRLVLLAPTTPFLLKPPDNPRGVDGGLFAETRDEWRRDFAQWVRVNEGPYSGDGLPGCAASPQLRDWTKSDMLTTTLQARHRLPEYAAQNDFREELTRVAVPTLIVQGDADASAPLALTGTPTAELVPNCRLVVYQNAPHGLYLTHREQVNGDLLAFIESREPVDSAADGSGLAASV